jgi:hypothetical protein
VKRLLIASVSVGLLAAAVAAAPAGAGGGTIFAPRDCTKPKVEPRSITLTCADAGIVLKHMRWSTWNTPKVKGRGHVYIKSCKPNCAAGGVKKFKVKVTLLNPMPSTCGGRMLRMYRRAHLRFPDRQPKHPRQFRSFQISCNR